MIVIANTSQALDNSVHPIDFDTRCANCNEITTVRFPFSAFIVDISDDTVAMLPVCSMCIREEDSLLDYRNSLNHILNNYYQGNNKNEI